jgi:hypothetical protein
MAMLTSFLKYQFKVRDGKSVSFNYCINVLNQETQYTVQKEEYIRQLGSYLYQCYNTSIYSHEMELVSAHYEGGTGVAECAEAIYTLREQGQEE